jgi:hypothetical protein
MIRAVHEHLGILRGFKRKKFFCRKAAPFGIILVSQLEL